MKKKTSKKGKMASVGAIDNMPYQQIVGAIGGALASKKLLPKLVDKVEFLKENPMVMQLAKIGVGIGLTILVENAWVHGIGIGIAADGASDLIGEKISMDGIGTAMDNAPVQQVPRGTQPLYLNGIGMGIDEALEMRGKTEVPRGTQPVYVGELEID